MATDRVDKVLDDWNEERPELAIDALGIVLRIQVLEKMLSDSINKSLSQLDLEWWEYDVLSFLRRLGEPYRSTASDIAEASMLSPGALTNRIDHMLERKFVTRQEDPEDRRRVLISLTPKGVKIADAAAKARFKCAEKAINSLTENQCSQLDNLLKKMLVSLEEDSLE
jgi:DNA-binding MarR family transcriptional regulator